LLERRISGVPRPIDWEERPLRSFLFTPGNHARRLQRVADFGSDVIVLDLEDAVAAEEKDAARGTARAALGTYDERQIVVVRVNGADTGRLEADVAAVACDELDAIMVPKVEDADTLRSVAELLGDDGRIRLFGVIETAKGVVRCEEICAAAPQRVVTVLFGAADFTLDLGVDLTPAARELDHARGRIVVAAAAGGLAPPVDGPWLFLQDADGLAADSLRSRALGFQGRVVVYPPQVEVVQRAYADLPAEEAESARRIVAAFEAALAEGVASIQVDGRFVDYPLYERAKRKLRLYEALHA
jgi:citrate lyase subunit beta/citryl-CoA lyase